MYVTELVNREFPLQNEYLGAAVLQALQPPRGNAPANHEAIMKPIDSAFVEESSLLRSTRVTERMFHHRWNGRSCLMGQSHWLESSIIRTRRAVYLFIGYSNGIRPSETGLAEGRGSRKPQPSIAKQGKNGFGKAGYGGPCPPSGTNCYYLYALDRDLSNLRSAASRQELDNSIREHILGETRLMGRYQRKQSGSPR